MRGELAGPRSLSERNRHFPLFDGFRAVAAFLIVVLHVSNQTGADQRHIFGALLARFDVSVPVFFAISGFLLYRPFVVDHLMGIWHVDLRGFFWRRFLRIVPAYWLLVTFAAVGFGTIRIRGVKDAILAYGLLWPYRTSWANRFPGLFTVWSLAVEVAFYLVLPFFAVVLGRFVARRAHKLAVEVVACAAIIVGGFAIYAWLTWSRPDGTVSTQWLPAQVEFFGIGMLLAVLSAQRTRSTEAIGRVFGAAPALWWATAAGAVALTAWGIGLPHGDFFAVVHPGEHFLQEVLYAVATVALLVPGIWGPQHKGAIRAFLANRTVQYFGLVSYAVFLWHNQWVTWMLENWDLYRRLPSGRFVWFLAVVVAFATATAALSWHFVERPVLNLKSRGPGRPRARNA